MSPENKPIACDTTALDPSEWERHREVTTQLVKLAEQVEELENGFRLRLPGEGAVIKLAAEYMSRERVCCPFLTFEIGGSGAAEVVALEITGPSGTKEVLSEAFGRSG